MNLKSLPPFSFLFMRRVEEATTRMVDSQNDLQAQKRKNALLEKQLGKVKVEQQGQASKPGQPTPFSKENLKKFPTHPPFLPSSSSSPLHRWPQAQKRKNALLEKQLGKVKVEQQGQASKPGQFTPFCLLLTHPPLSSSFFLYLPALVTIHWWHPGTKTKKKMLSLKNRSGRWKWRIRSLYIFLPSMKCFVQL